MLKRLYPLHHQDALTTCAFDNKGHLYQQFLVVSTPYKDPIARKKRQ